MYEIWALDLIYHIHTDSPLSSTDTFLQVHVLWCQNVTMLSENQADTRGSEESALTNDFDDGDETD